MQQVRNIQSRNLTEKLSIYSAYKDFPLRQVSNFRENTVAITKDGPKVLTID